VAHHAASDETDLVTGARLPAAFPFWLALIGAWLEVVVLYLEKRANPLLRLSEDFVWMAPLALLTLTLVIVISCAVMGRVWRRGLAATLALFATASAAFMNLLILIPGFAHYAAAIVAAGLGVQTVRIVRHHSSTAARVAWRSAPWLIGGFVVTGSLMWMSLHPAAGPAATAVAAPPPPNVLLITLDTVRAANLSLYGYARQTTPRIDRFAARGSVFERAITSSPWTLPSHASMFTGRWPHELSANYTSPLDGRYPTLAEYLAGKGYTTAGFVANLGYCGYETGLGRGFHHYEDYPRSLGQIMSSSTLVRTVADNFRLRKWLQNDQHLNRISADALNARALAWLSTARRGPFFLFLNYFDAHEPYLPPPPFDRQFGPGRHRGQYSPLHRWLWDPKLASTTLDPAERQEEIDAYDGSLAYLDLHVGRLLDELDQRGILSNTVVVITADHGEEFGEHGTYEHGYSLYRAGVQVPLIVVSPGVQGSQRITTAVSLRSLAATIADLVGLGEGAPFPGQSLAGVIRAGTQPAAGHPEFAGPLLSEVSRAPGHPDWFPTSKGDLTAVAYEGFRYIRNGDGTEELYDFTNDPGEQRNLAPLTGHRPALEAARALLTQLIASPSGR
jgi:arylsulfatase A-like enzyme